MLKGFKSFLMQGNLIVIAVGLVVALAFSTLIKAFTDNIITPLVNAAGGGGTSGLGFTVKGQVVNFGAFISALIYFVIFMAVIYFVLVVPYRAYMAKRGTPVFGDPPPTKTCPYCLSGGHPGGGDEVQPLRERTTSHDLVAAQRCSRLAYFENPRACDVGPKIVVVRASDGVARTLQVPAGIGHSNTSIFDFAWAADGHSMLGSTISNGLSCLG